MTERKRKATIQCYTTPEIHEALRALAARNNRTISNMVEQLILAATAEPEQHEEPERPPLV